MRITTILLLVALMSVTFISLEQNKTIINQTVTIRSMMDNPACRIAPVWTGKTPQHKRYKVSDN